MHNNYLTAIPLATWNSYHSLHFKYSTLYINQRR